eukprot:jgi/Chlat1/3307/Chrsp22S03464
MTLTGDDDRAGQAQGALASSLPRAVGAMAGNLLLRSSGRDAARSGNPDDDQEEEEEQQAYGSLRLSKAGNAVAIARMRRRALTALFRTSGMKQLDVAQRAEENATKTASVRDRAWMLALRLRLLRRLRDADRLEHLLHRLRHVLSHPTTSAQQQQQEQQPCHPVEECEALVAVLLALADVDACGKVTPETGTQRTHDDDEIGGQSNMALKLAEEYLFCARLDATPTSAFASHATTRDHIDGSATLQQAQPHADWPFTAAPGIPCMTRRHRSNAHSSRSDASVSTSGWRLPHIDLADTPSSLDDAFLDTSSEGDDLLIVSAAIPEAETMARFREAAGGKDVASSRPGAVHSPAGGSSLADAYIWVDAAAAECGDKAAHSERRARSWDDVPTTLPENSVTRHLTHTKSSPLSSTLHAEDALLALQGFRASVRRLAASSSSRPRSSLASLLSSFVDAGEARASIDRFVAQYQAGTSTALCEDGEGGMMDRGRGLVLQAYVGAVANVLQQSSAKLQSMAALPRASSYDYDRGAKPSTLLQLLVSTEPIRDELATLATLCMCHPSPSETPAAFPAGAALLTYLHGLVVDEGSANNRMLRYLFERALQPYLAFIRSWIYSGNITDPYSEFVITDPKDSTPCFLQPVHRELLLAGEQLRLLLQYPETRTFALAMVDHHQTNIDDDPTLSIPSSMGIATSQARAKRIEKMWTKGTAMLTTRLAIQRQWMKEEVEADALAQHKERVLEVEQRQLRELQAEVRSREAKRAVMQEQQAELRLRALQRIEARDAMEQERATAKAQDMQTARERASVAATLVMEHLGHVETLEQRRALVRWRTQRFALDALRRSHLQRIADCEAAELAQLQQSSGHGADDNDDSNPIAIEESNQSVQDHTRETHTLTSSPAPECVGRRDSPISQSTAPVPLSNASECASDGDASICSEPATEAVSIATVVDDVEGSNIDDASVRGGDGSTAVESPSGRRGWGTPSTNPFPAAGVASPKPHVQTLNAAADDDDDVSLELASGRPSSDEATDLSDSQPTAAADEAQPAFASPDGVDAVQPSSVAEEADVSGDEDEDGLPLARTDVPARVAIDAYFSSEILAQYRGVSSCCVALLCDQLRLTDHCAALRRYFFMQAGDFADAFAEMLFTRAAHPGGWINPQTGEISAMLDRAIRASSCSGDEYASFLHVVVHDKDTPAVPVTADRVNAFDFIGLEYRVGWPLDAVLTPDVFDQYRKLFSFLLSTKVAIFALHDAWTSLQDLERRGRDQMRPPSSSSSSRSSKWARRLRRLHMFRHQLAHFMSILQGYLHTQLLDIPWAAFRRRLAESRLGGDADVSTLREAHRVYVEDATRRCLLHPEAKAVKAVVDEALQRLLDFRALLQQVPDPALLAPGGNDDRMYGRFRRAHVAFDEATKLMHGLLRALAARGQLVDLYTRLNFNHYFAADGLS